MEFDSKGTKVITTPNKERIEKVLDAVFTARHSQVNSDIVSGNNLNITLHCLR